MKANNQAEIQKVSKNPTTNYPFDTHKAFCKRCFLKHKGICPKTGMPILAKDCDL